MKQEDVYADVEADAFFERNMANININMSSGLRSSKEIIYDNITDCVGSQLNGSRVLEIGCFIGDLLAKLRDANDCIVTGIEPSKLACDFAKERFGLAMENCTFNKSSLFGLKESTRMKFDLIVVDDVLSWMSRDLILPALASIDWMLEFGGHLYIRDFSPAMDFAYPNHHQLDSDVWNYKVSHGHQKFFTSTGSYLVLINHTRISGDLQSASTARDDSMIWSDIVLRKVSTPLQPRLSLT